MKRVFTAPSVVTCDLISAFLRGSGIKCMIKNERGSGIAGEGLPVPGCPNLVWAWPEVWVPDDQAEDALCVVSAVQESATDNAEESIQHQNPALSPAAVASDEA